MQTPNVTPEAIREFRHETGMTQQDFAHMLNVGVSTVSLWETGHFKPTGTAVAILEALILGSQRDPSPGSKVPNVLALYRLLKIVFEGSEVGKRQARRQ